MLAIRFLKSIYPLLKDIFLEKKSIKEAAKDSKGKILLLLSVLVSIFLNFFLIPKILTLSNEIVILRKEQDRLKNELTIARQQLDDDPYVKSSNDTASDDDYYNRLDYYKNRLSDLRNSK